jgi:maltodextrin utilization protein YvdJ
MVKSLDQGQNSLISQIPDIQIQNGRVIVDQTEPLYITRKDGSAAVIIDTTGSMNYIDDDRVVALLTETSLIVRRGENAFNTFDLSTITDIHLNQYIANEWLQTAKGSIAPLSYGLFLMLSYVFAVMVMLLAAVIGLILSLVMRGTLNFASALRVATVAATPSIIFITISAALGFTMAPGIHLAVTLIYLVVGVSACSKQAEVNEEGKVDLKSLLNDDIASAQEAA